ncbi:hypothetical protein Bbelb_274860 [Branchiostoma belcheri]|nr:hypothetical protein Bbelb_274860 [Branchiostoma belcheri]
MPSPGAPAAAWVLTVGPTVCANYSLVVARFCIRVPEHGSGYEARFWIRACLRMVLDKARFWMKARFWIKHGSGYACLRKCGPPDPPGGRAESITRVAFEYELLLIDPLGKSQPTPVAKLKKTDNYERTFPQAGPKFPRPPTFHYSSGIRSFICVTAAVIVRSGKSWAMTDERQTALTSST